jgi:lipopolysaccharide assembly outer membrane protein LptD (OstA)
MKRLVLISCCAVFAFAQKPVPHGTYDVTANSIEVDGPVRHLSGNVRIESDTILLRADQADFNDDTDEIVAHGELRLKLKQRGELTQICSIFLTGLVQ